jgi:hypothetical protein
VASGSAVDLVVSSGPANQRPLVTINMPTDGTSFNLGDPISFGGSASDPEDGDLTASLIWSSDRDRVIGTGGSFSTTLSAGTHVITASVTDSAGQPDADAIVITVLTTGDNLRCLETVYKVERDELLFEVKSSDKTGGRILTAVMDVDGDGVFDREIGEVPVKSESSDAYQFRGLSFADPNPTAASVIRVTSDLGGICNTNVKID